MSILELLKEKKDNIERLLGHLDWQDQIEQLAEACIKTFDSGGKILVCGNGGSAAQAQHFSAEMVVRFQKWRQALPMISLTTDTSILTAYSNDDDFERVFARQIDALAQPGDLLIVFSTSGNSPNIVAAVHTANQKMAKSYAFTGLKKSSLSDMDCDLIATPGQDTAQIQEGHLIAIHLICLLVENHYLCS